MYTYDLGGNITSKTTYTYTLDAPTTVLDTAAYSYYTGTWKDLLVGYDGLTINSDTIGNPTEVKQGDTVIRRYTWEHGRQLASLTEDGTTWNYTYNTAGLRTERTNGTKTYTYVYNGSQLTYMTVDGHTLWFSYDAQGPMYVKYDGSTYQYITNLQGDIIAIANSQGNVVVEYTYDAWGNILSVTGTMADTLGKYNPLRYRGYVYDTESRLYYLQSRYYDPEMGRFINADALASTGQGLLGNNMFAYCLNNPVILSDENGYLGLWALCGIGAAVGALVNYAEQVITNYKDGKSGVEAWTDVNVGEIASSAFSGAIAAIPGSGAWGDTVDAIGSNLIEYGVNALVYGEKVSLKEVGKEITSDLISSAFLPDLLPTKDVPKFIRDIKSEAREAGIKGTRKLQQYLDFTQVTTIITNTFNSSTSSNILEQLGWE